MLWIFSHKQLHTHVTWGKGPNDELVTSFRCWPAPPHYQRQSDALHSVCIRASVCAHMCVCACVHILECVYMCMPVCMCV